MAIVNFESVATAADALVAEGKRASVRNVIDKLGGGSPNAVLLELREWKNGRPIVRIADAELDSRITMAIKEQMQRVATAAAVAAEERAAALDDDLQMLAEAQALAERRIEVLIAERDVVQAQAKDVVEQLKNAEAEIEREAQRVAQQLAVLREELAAERQRQEVTAGALTRAEVRLEAVPVLQAEVERLRAALDVESIARTTAERQAAVEEAKLEGMTERTQKAEARAERLETQFQQSAHELITARSNLSAQQSALEVAAHELAGAQQAVKDAQAEAKKAAEEAAELRGASAAVPIKKSKKSAKPDDLWSDEQST